MKQIFKLLLISSFFLSTGLVQASEESNELLINIWLNPETSTANALVNNMQAEKQKATVINQVGTAMAAEITSQDMTTLSLLVRSIARKLESGSITQAKSDINIILTFILGPTIARLGGEANFFSSQDVKDEKYIELCLALMYLILFKNTERFNAIGDFKRINASQLVDAYK